MNHTYKTQLMFREIEDLNNEESLPTNVMLVSMDVSSLYTDIPHDEGIESTRNALTGSKQQKNFNRIQSETI